MKKKTYRVMIAAEIGPGSQPILHTWWEADDGSKINERFYDEPQDLNRFLSVLAAQRG